MLYYPSVYTLPVPPPRLHSGLIRAAIVAPEEPPPPPLPPLLPPDPPPPTPVIVEPTVAGAETWVNADPSTGVWTKIT